MNLRQRRKARWAATRKQWRFAPNTPKAPRRSEDPTSRWAGPTAFAAVVLGHVAAGGLALVTPRPSKAAIAPTPVEVQFREKTEVPTAEKAKPPKSVKGTEPTAEKVPAKKKARRRKTRPKRASKVEAPKK